MVCTYEPTVHATIVAPSEHLGAVMQLCTARRAEQLEYSYINANVASSSGSSGAGGFESLSSMTDGGSDGSGAMGDRVVLRYRLPLSELAGDYYSRLKAVTHG